MMRLHSRGSLVILGHCSDSEHDNAYTLSKPTHLVSWPSLNCSQGFSGFGDFHAELIIVVVESPWPVVNSALAGCCTSQGAPATASTATPFCPTKRSCSASGSASSFTCSGARSRAMRSSPACRHLHPHHALLQMQKHSESSKQGVNKILKPICLRVSRSCFMCTIRGTRTYWPPFLLHLPALPPLSAGSKSGSKRSQAIAGSL